jgi:hypothetical protein
MQIKFYLSCWVFTVGRNQSRNLSGLVSGVGSLNICVGQGEFTGHGRAASGSCVCGETCMQGPAGLI